MVDIITLLLVVGMSFLLSFFNRNVQTYVSYMRKGAGELSCPSTIMTKKRLIVAFIKSLFFAFFKHLLLHIIIFILPFLILPFIYKMSQKVFNEWYLSGATRILATLTGFCLVVIPSVVLLWNSNKWMRIYYFLFSFLINGIVAILWWGAL